MAKVKITFPSMMAIDGRVEIDGKDISSSIRSLRLVGDAGSTVRLELELRPEAVEIIADDAQVEIRYQK